MQTVASYHVVTLACTLACTLIRHGVISRMMSRMMSRTFVAGEYEKKKKKWKKGWEALHISAEGIGSLGNLGIGIKWWGVACASKDYSTRVVLTNPEPSLLSVLISLYHLTLPQLSDFPLLSFDACSTKRASTIASIFIRECILDWLARTIARPCRFLRAPDRV